MTAWYVRMSVIHGHADAYKLIETAGLCFDLRKLCTSSEPDGEREALKPILSVAANSGVVFDVRAGRAALLDQLETLRVRLSDAAKTYPYNERWFVAKERCQRPVSWHRDNEGSVH